ncbi:UNVERIFIED_CONTAM: Autophagy-related protein 8i [Sesamum radiatum]|uniref:Autophagy-related protein n=1 Tax=Sesamum radiatum TaxID=300843 RepID=A0AAW2UTI1_SESRA
MRTAASALEIQSSDILQSCLLRWFALTLSRDREKNRRWAKPRAKPSRKSSLWRKECKNRRRLSPSTRIESLLWLKKYTKSDLPEMEKKKFLVPRDMSVGQFIHILSARLHLAPGKALFVFVKNTLPQTSSLIESVYDSFKDEDGFLYMCYSSEKTFG